MGSVTVAEVTPEDVPVVGAFHNLSASRLASLDTDLGIDTLIVGDDVDAKTTVMELAESIDGLRALNGGPLANSAEIETVTSLLINIARYNDELYDLGVEFR